MWNAVSTAASAVAGTVSNVADGLGTALDLSQSALTGALDVVAVTQLNGEIKSTPFHVRIGKFNGVARGSIVRIIVNDVRTDVVMRRGRGGECHFVHITKHARDMLEAARRELGLKSTNPVPTHTRYHYGTDDERMENSVISSSSTVSASRGASPASPLYLDDGLVGRTHESSPLTVMRGDDFMDGSSCFPMELRGLPELQADGRVTIRGKSVGTAKDWEVDDEPSVVFLRKLGDKSRMAPPSRRQLGYLWRYFSGIDAYTHDASCSSGDEGDDRSRKSSIGSSDAAPSNDNRSTQSTTTTTTTTRSMLTGVESVGGARIRWGSIGSEASASSLSSSSSSSAWSLGGGSYRNKAAPFPSTSTSISTSSPNAPPTIPDCASAMAAQQQCQSSPSSPALQAISSRPLRGDLHDASTVDIFENADLASVQVAYVVPVWHYTFVAAAAAAAGSAAATAAGSARAIQESPLGGKTAVLESSHSRGPPLIKQGALSSQKIPVVEAEKEVLSTKEGAHAPPLSTSPSGGLSSSSSSKGKTGDGSSRGGGWLSRLWGGGAGRADGQALR